jgi:NAD(P)H-quinone oxidoreductase subunit 4
MLSVLLWLPVLGALVITLIPGHLPVKYARWTALGFASLVAIWTGVLFSQFDLGNSGLQLTEYLPWITNLGLSYSLGVDGLSLPLIGLSNFLTLVVVFGGVGKIMGHTTATPPDRSRLFYTLVLFVNAGISGALMAQNLLLFVIFYELELIPFYLLIVIWGGKAREYAAMKFLIYTAISGLMILLGVLALGVLGGFTSFDYADIQAKVGSFSQITQLILLTIFLVGFGIKTPLIPLHSWLPDAYVEASSSVAILLGGALSKLGTYGLVRFCLGLFPETWKLIAPGLSILAAVSVMYGALAAIAQKDIKRMVAYSSIAHMGYVLLGIIALTPLALVGAVGQMVSHGLILALLFYLVGIIEAKVGTRELDVLNGLLNPLRGLPTISALLILGGMASAGIPGLVGFIAEFMVFQGSFSVYPIPTLLCVVASMFTAVYFVILLNRTCFGKLDNYTAHYPRVTNFEQIPALVLTAIIFFLGVQPSWLVRWSEKTTASLIAAVPSDNPSVIAANLGHTTIGHTNGGITFAPRNLKFSAPPLKP